MKHGYLPEGIESGRMRWRRQPCSLLKVKNVRVSKLDMGAMRAAGSIPCSFDRLQPLSQASRDLPCHFDQPTRYSIRNNEAG